VQFASLWSQMAAKYANTSNIIFGVMNEPHDRKPRCTVRWDVSPTNQTFEVPSITTWAASVQAAVTAIRNAGATKQMILLPGSE
jgi:endoglucanase